MKDWQHGYELDYLKELESLYADYNKFADSPFAEYKKNNIAEDLHKGLLQLDDVGSYVQTKVSKSSPITMYPGVTIGIKTPGDYVITKLRGTDDYVESICEKAEGNTWLYVWAEDKTTRYIAQHHFQYIGAKITTFGEIYSIYFKEGVIPRSHPFVDPVEKIAVKQLQISVDTDIIEKIREKLENLNIKFQNHYSNYNKKKSWSAISLRGYSSDIIRIEKPIEMSKKWKEEHKDEELYLQDTHLRNEFPEVDELLKFLGDAELHRIRFMRLVPGGGELTRHTDQVDPDSGCNIGNISRLHFPIQTNERVRFGVWEPNGEKREVNMKVGECWVLDTRKPHTVINEGTEDRIHLVIDVKTDKNLKEIILQ
ncbi:MAG: hypothetical protein EBU90_16585 [Proteobacteria bacterium]|nr:hypothetical protein [Pseudomonadota bacterium]